MKISALLTFIILIFHFAVKAQDNISCTYTLELYDSYGDGWNDAYLTLFLNHDTTTFTLDAIHDNGFFGSFPVEVTQGDTAAFYFTSGDFDGELAYAIFNPEGIRVFADGPNPLANILFRAIVQCPTCLVTPPSSVKVGDVRAFTAGISWDAVGNVESYLVEYGPKGFTHGMGSYASTLTDSITLRNLQEKTDYEFYVSSICAGADTSHQVGPYEFSTLWANDVGVVSISTPQTQCGLGPDEKVTVTLKNFGGNPQSLIPFKYSVNGVDAGVSMPTDGFFTGVLGKDSTYTIEFKTKFNFSVPAVYVIQAWTELDGEKDTSNDTTTVTITNIPIIAQYPYVMDFEQWGGGWTVMPSSRNSSWEYGIPQGTVISSAASGQYAWVTNLDSTYNNSELSYLLSPCLNFSSLAEDPRISFALNLNTEECCDKGWLEVSIDGGENWTKVGAAGTGINWYNDATNNWWKGNGGVNGWRTATNVLTGTAFRSDVRLRFVFSSDFAVSKDGMGIDDIFISTPLARDLAALSATHTVMQECGSANDRVSVTIGNFGSSTTSGFNVSYQVNGGDIVTENVDTLSIAPGSQANYTFTTPLNTTVGNNFNVVVWTAAAGELFPANDTTSFTFSTARNLPFSENFESGTTPAGWTFDNLTSVGQGHGNTSYVVSDNLSSIDRSMEVITPALGLIEAGDSLTFDYRIVNFNGNTATTLSPGDSIAVQISTDCGGSYTTVYTINSSNHTPSSVLKRVVIHLDNYVGQVVKFRLRATWGSGDYWVDFDNFNIIHCPASLELTTEIRDESTSGAEDGQATVAVGAGVAPYTYLWSNGTSDKTAIRLAGGDYTVTVTDRFGCKDVTTVQVGTLTDISEPELITQVILAPNPTSGETLLKAQIAEVSDVQVQLYDLNGRLLFQTLERNTRTLNIPIDMRNHPAGIYLLRLVANDQMRTEKLVKTE